MFHQDTLSVYLIYFYYSLDDCLHRCICEMEQRKSLNLCYHFHSGLTCQILHQNYAGGGSHVTGNDIT